MVRIMSFLTHVVGLLIIFIFIYCNMSPCFPYDTCVTRQGYYVDLRGQVEDGILPPHPENIPEMPRVQQNIVSFDQYFNVNCDGYRRDEDYVPIVPEYSTHYSERTMHPYTKEQYIEVWRSGPKVGKIDCLTDEYAISFFSVNNWFTGITMACWRARKVPQKAACFLYVEEVGADTEAMYNAKKWAELWNVKIFFGTIDRGIPVDWVQ